MVLEIHSEYFSGLTQNRVSSVRCMVLILEVQFHGVNAATVHIIYHKIVCCTRASSSWAPRKMGLDLVVNFGDMLVIP
jgi:hypothetical protein